MKIKRIIPFTAAIIIAGSFQVMAQAERFVTVSLFAGPVSTNFSGPIIIHIAGTNTVDILEGETGELITLGAGVGETVSPVATVTKNGVTINAQAASALPLTQFNLTPGPRGTTVAGPATFSITGTTDSEQIKPITGIMTVKITPQTFASDKTVLVAPGMGNVQINLESSTNLNQWSTATNGVYSDDMRFFRIKLNKVN